MHGCGQYDGLGEYCDLITASEEFLIFTTQIHQYFSVFIYLRLSFYLSTSLKYALLNTPKQHYFMLLTSGG